jgi:DNA-binding CsgD family transcriptional regulator
MSSSRPPAGRRGRPPYPDVLTPREWEVLALLREGLSDQSIADRLGISLDGAKYHVREILSKLGVASRQEAAVWQPDAPAPARRWAVLELAARIAGALAVVAAVAGLGVLAWGVVRTSGGDDVPEVLASPSPIHEGGPGRSVWEPAGPYRADHNDVALTILWFRIDTNAHVEYALTHADPNMTVSPGDLRLTDDAGTSYPLRYHAVQGQALGVTIWRTSFSRPPDAGETLTLTLTNPTSSTPSGETASIGGSWEVSFIRNVDLDHGSGYTEGVRIAPENVGTHGARLLYGAGFTQITREGEHASIPW